MSIEKDTRAVKKQKAKRLFIYQGKNQSQTAKIVHVTEKTVGKWVKQFNWNELRDAVIEKRLGSNEKAFQPATLTLNDFLEFMKENSPLLAGKVEPIMQNYINLIP